MNLMFDVPDLVVDGFKSLSRGSPNMNSLVALGSFASFGISSVRFLIIL